MSRRPGRLSVPSQALSTVFGMDRNRTNASRLPSRPHRAGALHSVPDRRPTSPENTGAKCVNFARSVPKVCQSPESP